MFEKLSQKTYVDFALLVTRAVAGFSLAFTHGLGKLQGFGEMFHTFGDPLGVGSELSYILAVGAEFFCALLVAVGFFSRLATIPLLILFGVIFFAAMANAPYSDKEISVLFFAAFFTTFLAGPGKYSIDHMLRGKKKY
jgi:putative oxidoreductase